MEQILFIQYPSDLLGQNEIKSLRKTMSSLYSYSWTGDGKNNTCLSGQWYSVVAILDIDCRHNHFQFDILRAAPEEEKNYTGKVDEFFTRFPIVFSIKKMK